MVFLNLVGPWRMRRKTVVVQVACRCCWCENMRLCCVCHHWTHKVASGRVLFFFCDDESLVSGLSSCGWGANGACRDLLFSWQDLSHCGLEMIISSSYSFRLEVPSEVPCKLIIIIVIGGVIHYLVISRFHLSPWTPMIFLLVKICCFLEIILHCLFIASRSVLVIVIVFAIAWFQCSVIIHSHEST